MIIPYILKTIWCMDIILWDYESVWHDIWRQNKCKSIWPLFHGRVILPYILNTIWYITPFLGIMSFYDPMFDLRINVGHCDLYFMFQWFCLISWQLFSGWTSYFGILSQHDLTCDLKICVDHCDLCCILHGPLNLPYILKTVWCRNIILCDNESV